MTKQTPEKDNNAFMKQSFLIPAAVIPVLCCLSHCTRKPLLPDYTPLCSGAVPGEQSSRLLQPGEKRIYRVGPKGGIYYINSHNKKVYIKSRRTQ